MCFSLGESSDTEANNDISNDPVRLKSNEGRFLEVMILLLIVSGLL
jgi:hypothetical protein